MPYSFRTEERVKLKHVEEPRHMDAVLVSIGTAFGARSYDFAWRSTTDQIGVVEAVDMSDFSVRRGNGSVEVVYNVSNGGKCYLSKNPMRLFSDNDLSIELRRRKFDEYDAHLKTSRL